MNEHLGSINPLATASYDYTHCIVLSLETTHCGSFFFIWVNLDYLYVELLNLTTLGESSEPPSLQKIELCGYMLLLLQSAHYTSIKQHQVSACTCRWNGRATKVDMIAFLVEWVTRHLSNILSKDWSWGRPHCGRLGNDVLVSLPATWMIKVWKSFLWIAILFYCR